MKKILAFLIYPYTYFKNRKREKTFDELLYALELAVQKKRAKQEALKADIHKYMGKYLRFGANSEFIPFDGRSEFEIRQIMDKKYGSRMKKLDVTLNGNMVLEFA